MTVALRPRLAERRWGSSGWLGLAICPVLQPPSPLKLPRSRCSAQLLARLRQPAAAVPVRLGEAAGGQCWRWQRWAAAVIAHNAAAAVQRCSGGGCLGQRRRRHWCCRCHGLQQRQRACRKVGSVGCRLIKLSSYQSAAHASLPLPGPLCCPRPLASVPAPPLGHCVHLATTLSLDTWLQPMRSWL